MQRWYDCLDCGSASGTKCEGKPAAMGARDMALLRAFSGAQHKTHEGQPWPGLFWRPTAVMQGPALRGLILLLGSQRTRAIPERASFIVHQQVPVCGERKVTIVAPPPVCDSAVVPCFHGSPVFLRRHLLWRISSFPSPQSISPQPTAVLALGLFSNPHGPAPGLLAHL